MDILGRALSCLPQPLTQPSILTCSDHWSGPDPLSKRPPLCCFKPSLSHFFDVWCLDACSRLLPGMACFSLLCPFHCHLTALQQSHEHVPLTLQFFTRGPPAPGQIPAPPQLCLLPCPLFLLSRQLSLVLHFHLSLSPLCLGICCSLRLECPFSTLIFQENSYSCHKTLPNSH